MIDGAVVIDISHLSEMGDLERLDRHRLDVLERVPDGASVTVEIGGRQFVSQDAALWLHRHDSRLNITITGTSPEAVATFVKAARAGLWEVA